MAKPWEKYQKPDEQRPWTKYAAPQEVVEQTPTVEEPSLFQRAADFVTGESRMTPEMESMSEIGNAPELNEMSWSAFKTSLGLLATGDTDKAKNVIKSNIPDAEFTEDAAGNTIVNLPSGQYALNKPGVSPQDIAKGVFDIAAFTPAGRAASIPGAVAKSAATEAAMQGVTQQVGGGDADLKDIALSGVVGGLGKGVEDVATTAYRAMTGAATPQQRALTQFAESEGLPLTTTDVVPPETFVGKSAQAAAEKVPVAGTGAMRAEQQQARSQLVEDFSSKFGDYDPSEVVSSLQRQTNKVKKAAGNTRGRIVEQVGEVPTASPRTIQAIDEEIERLSKLGEVADTQTIDTLNRYKNQLQTEGADFNQLEQLRTQFRQDVKGERTAWPGRSEAAANRIYRSMTDDMDDVVRESLGPKEAARWKKSNTIYGEEANKIKNTRLKNVLNKGELTPEVVNNMLFSNKPSEVKNLYRSLDTKGKEAARAGVVGKAWEKSGGSPDRFLNELNRLSNQTGILFKGKDRAYINGLKDYLQSTKRAAEAGVRTPTGQELFQIAAPSAVVGDVMTTGGGFTLGAGGYGLLSRAYESKPIRNAVIKLNSIPKGSTEFEEQARKIQSLITSEMQRQRRQE